MVFHNASPSNDWRLGKIEPDDLEPCKTVEVAGYPGQRDKLN